MKKLAALIIAGAMTCGLPAIAADAPRAPLPQTAAEWLATLPPPAKSTSWSGRFMPFDLALEMARTAIETCRARGAHVSVTVVDATGMMRLFLMDDGARLNASEASKKKAFTAASVVSPTAQLAQTPNLQDRLRDVMGDKALVVSGARLITVGDEMIGVIALGGRSGPEENYCAQVGIEKIQSRLR